MMEISNIIAPLVNDASEKADKILNSPNEYNKERVQHAAGIIALMSLAMAQAEELERTLSDLYEIANWQSDDVKQELD